MGKVRAVANGNVFDEADVHPSLIDAGVYERIDGKAAPVPPTPAPAPSPEPTPPAPSGPVGPLTTADMPTGKKAKK